MSESESSSQSQKHIEPCRPHRPGCLNGYHGCHSVSIPDPTTLSGDTEVHSTCHLVGAWHTVVRHYVNTVSACFVPCCLLQWLACIQVTLSATFIALCVVVLFLSGCKCRKTSEVVGCWRAGALAAAFAIAFPYETGSVLEVWASYLHTETCLKRIASSSCDTWVWCPIGLPDDLKICGVSKLCWNRAQCQKHFWLSV